MQPMQQEHDFTRTVGVQRAGRFVGQDDLPTVHQRAGQGHALLLAARKLIRQVSTPFLQAHSLKQRRGPLAPGRGTLGTVDRRHFHVLQGAEPRQQQIALENEPEVTIAQPGEFIRCHRLRWLTVDEIAALRRPVHAAQHVHQCRLARARGTDNGDELTCADGQAEIAQRDH